jgi:hypothetical protein
VKSKMDARSELSHAMQRNCGARWNGCWWYNGKTLSHEIGQRRNGIGHEELNPNVAEVNQSSWKPNRISSIKARAS